LGLIETDARITLDGTALEGLLSRAMIDTKELDAEWTAALIDAGIDREQTRLYVFDDAKGTDTSGAVWFRPGNDLVVDHHFPNKDYLADANKDEHRVLHRIAVWRGVELPILGARMRHELEHALQWDRYGYPIYALYDLVVEVLSHKAAGLEGCGGMYVNAIPAEQDANAAAAIFLRNHHSEAVEAVRQDVDSRMLACSLVGPEGLETLLGA
jgi:hypothetical protein